MVEPVKNDMVSTAGTIGTRALLGAIVGGLATAVVGALLGGAFGNMFVSEAAKLAGTWTTSLPTIGAIAGFVGMGWVGGTTGAMIGGAAGAATGLNQVAAEGQAYNNLVAKREAARANVVGKVREAALEEGIMLGYQQAKQDDLPQMQAAFMKGREIGQHEVVAHVQEQMAAQAKAAQQPDKVAAAAAAAAAPEPEKKFGHIKPRGHSHAKVAMDEKAAAGPIGHSPA